MRIGVVSVVCLFMLSGFLLLRTCSGYVRLGVFRPPSTSMRLLSTKVSTTLYQDLKDWRKRLADETQKPLYMILSNKLIETIAMDKPQSLEQLYALSGFGEKKLKKYGRSVLDMVQKHQHDDDENFDIAAQKDLNEKIDATFWASVKAKEKTKVKKNKHVDPDKLEARRRKKIEMLSETAITELKWPEIALSDLNPEQQTAAAYVLQGNNAFITGSAGTGKSFLLRYIIQELEKQHGEKGTVAVTAPTGIAAININGQTIHSFAGIGLGQGEPALLLAKVLKSTLAQERWNKCNVLVIDEISMLSYEMFELLDEIARTVRENSAPFGGLQVVAVGDFMQLPPVTQSRRGGQMKFCFQSPVWEKAGFNAKNGMQFLKQVERQKDQDFVDFLNQVRVGQLTHRMNTLLEQCLVSNKPPPQNGIIPTKLYAINAEVDAENTARLQELPGEVHTMTAVDKWVKKPSKASMVEFFRIGLDNMVPEEIHLKVGAQVMLLRNRAKGQFGALGQSTGPSLVNGSRGKIIGFVESVLRPGLIVPSVMFDNGVVTTIGPTEYLYKGPGGDGECLRMQIPLKLAWAVTVHKSQGCTLTCAELMLDKTFDYGQVYVALSRVKSLAGLWLRTALDPATVKAHPEVLKFYGVDPATMNANIASTAKRLYQLKSTSANAVPLVADVASVALDEGNDYVDAGIIGEVKTTMPAPAVVAEPIGTYQEKLSSTNPIQHKQVVQGADTSIAKQIIPTLPITGREITAKDVSVDSRAAATRGSAVGRNAATVPVFSIKAPRTKK